METTYGTRLAAATLGVTLYLVWGFSGALPRGIREAPTKDTLADSRPCWNVKDEGNQV